MAAAEVIKIITDFSSYYGQTVNKLNCSFEKVPVTQTNSKTDIQGLRNLVWHLSKPGNPEQDVIQDQWLEYILILIGNLESSAVAQVLNELNSYISDKVFFVGNQLGPVDILMYYLMYSSVLNLTFQEKEKYLHFSRWFNNVQQLAEASTGKGTGKRPIFEKGFSGSVRKIGFEVEDTNRVLDTLQGHFYSLASNHWYNHLFSGNKLVFNGMFKPLKNVSHSCRMMSSVAGDEVVPVAEAKRLIKDCFVAVNTKPEHAEQMADLLVGADHRGHFSHGLNRLQIYIKDIEAGLCNQNAKPVVLKETPATAWVDGQCGLGVVVGNFCMDVAVEKAKNCGVGWVAAKSSNHFGMAGWYTLRAMKHNMIGMTFTNTSPFLCPTRAKKAALGTNPLSVAAPGKDGDGFFLDMATTAVALGKIEIQQRKNEPIPEGWALDGDGLPTTDPITAQKFGRLMPLGGSEFTSGYKGYGLAHMVEIFCGLLAGATYGPNIRKWGSTERTADLGQCFVAINPECFAPGFQDRVSDLNSILHNLEPVDPNSPVLVAGDPEKKRMEIVDKQGGIRYHENQIKAANEIAQNLKVAPLKLQKINSL